jgi:hypothetical protein
MQKNRKKEKQGEKDTHNPQEPNALPPIGRHNLQENTITLPQQKDHTPAPSYQEASNSHPHQYRQHHYYQN